MNSIGMNFEGPKPDAIRELGTQVLSILNVRVAEAVQIKALEVMRMLGSYTVQNCCVTQQEASKPTPLTNKEFFDDEDDEFL